MRCTITDTLGEVPAADWNRLAGARNPFVRHEFLVALERNECVGDRTGWWPRHVLVHDDDDHLVGAAPMYLKDNSFGEFVFDWAWADAYSRHGVPYYPKLVIAVPFTPVTGPRLLVDPQYRAGPIKTVLVEAALSYASSEDVSSLHCLFTTPEDTQHLQDCQLMRRVGCQFHWENPGYRDFDDYLDRMSSKKRKQIKRERREAAASGLDVEVLNGHQITASQWDAYHRFYSSTYDRKWGSASLTRAYFEELGETMPDSVVLVLASRDGHPVAGAFGLRGSDTLFGRHWGCHEHHRSLHFEMCYYRMIQFCIENGLARFEAGAQGEHKISRGFLPNATWSAHWIQHDGFKEAIGDFLRREHHGMEQYIAGMGEHSPFKTNDTLELPEAVAKRLIP